ncbi:MAG: hypothetical protein ABIB04_04260 [Patescibacteria group bacterium]
MPETIEGSNVKEASDNVASGKSFWRACFIGCAILIAVFFIGGYLIFRFLFGPADKILASLPENYPKQLTPYRLNEVRSIRYLSGQNRSKAIKIFSAPISLISGLGLNSGSSSTQDMKTYQDVVGSISNSLSNKETVTMVWNAMQANKKDVLDYYSKLAKDAGMTEKIFRDEVTSTDLYVAQGSDMALQLYLQDLSDTPNLDKITLVVDYLAK